jgi:hypothetical protein
MLWNQLCPSYTHYTHFSHSDTARRISAISIAERVNQEQCLTEHDIGGLIGYQVRLESKVSQNTQLLFLTPGVLLRKLQSSPSLAEYTHVIIDEIHERDKYTEFLLITLRDLLPVRPDLRVILMSATLQTEKLKSYFAEYDHPFYQNQQPVLAVVEMQGRTFPVQEFFLESVLQMTGYIEDVVVPTTTATDSDSQFVSSDELEQELAKLIGGGPPVLVAAASEAVSVAAPSQPASSLLKCAMCGQGGFGNAIDLGAHLGACDGQRRECELDTTQATIDNNNGILDNNNHDDDDDGGDQVTNFDDFDDYDVDGAMEVECDLLDVEELKPQEPERPEKEKWDGESPFVISNDNAPTLSMTEEQLLDQYQVMHDDEQVDTDLLLEVLHYIIQSSNGDGAILVFLPGWREISEVNMILESTAPFRDRTKYLVLPLHSGIPSKDQRRVLQRPPKGMRKIVLSTNIAETSLTIEDVSFVVDTGRAKEKDYDPHLKTSTLQATWISQASSKQRKGRAGRTKAGVCFHLFSSRRHSSMRAFVESELLRTPLVRWTEITFG